jgi:hypothetical protein
MISSSIHVKPHASLKETRTFEMSNIFHTNSIGAQKDKTELNS